MKEVDKFVTQQIAELSELVGGKTFRAKHWKPDLGHVAGFFYSNVETPHQRPFAAKCFCGISSLD